MKFKKIFMLILSIILLFGSCIQLPDLENFDVADINTTFTETMPESVETDEFTEEVKYENSDEDESGLKNGFIFIYNDTTVYLDEYIERVLTELEPPMEFYEYQSCSFEGMAKIYSYNEFQLSTYVKDTTDEDRVYSVDIYDDSISTAEGIYIGQTYDDMIRAYGTEYEELQGFVRIYRYTKDGTVLSFGIEDGMIISISYNVEYIYEN